MKLQPKILSSLKVREGDKPTNQPTDRPTNRHCSSWEFSLRGTQKEKLFEKGEGQNNQPTNIYIYISNLSGLVCRQFLIISRRFSQEEEIRVYEVAVTANIGMQRLDGLFRHPYHF